MTDFMTRLTYGQFLVIFLLPPIAELTLLVLRDRRRHGSCEKSIEKHTQVVGRWWLLVGLVVLAIVYTIPWDNHLIDEGVWSYVASRVNGITLGWIPLEEVLFFPLQTILVGLWVLWLAPRVTVDNPDRRAVAGENTVTVRTQIGGTATLADPRTRARQDVAPMIRWIAVAAASVAWLVGLVILLRGWRPGTYLGWELVWALPPLALQLGLGGDLLWHQRRLVLAALTPAVMYLCAADALAIHTGIWTIAPQQSLGVLLGGVLPLEELVFFLLTSALVTGGLIIGMAPEMRKRLHLGP